MFAISETGETNESTSPAILFTSDKGRYHIWKGKPMMPASPEQAVELLDRAFNAGDLDTVLTFYEDAAVVVTEPGKVARDASELRDFFSNAMRSGASTKQLKTSVLEADGVALFLSRWTLRMQGQDTEQTFVATTVFRNRLMEAGRPSSTTLSDR